MKINEIIKSKRLELGLTQEQLAKYLNLTTSAVNKWEREISYPDITILPALARILKTDLNSLLSFKEDLSDYEIGMFLNELTAIKDFDIAYNLAIDKINEYPTCYNLILNVAICLEGVFMMNQAANSKSYQSSIEELFQRCLMSNDETIKNQVYGVLINKYLKQNKLGQAEALINELPDKNVVDKKQKLINLYISQERFEEAAKLQEEQLLTSVNEISNMLLVLMEIAKKQGFLEEAKYIADIFKDMHTLFSLWEYSSYNAHFQLALKMKDKKESLKLLKMMFKALDKNWELKEIPLYQHLETKKIDQNFGQQMRNMIIASINEDEETKFLKGEKELELLCNQYSI